MCQQQSTQCGYNSPEGRITRSSEMNEETRAGRWCETSQMHISKSTMIGIIRWVSSNIRYLREGWSADLRIFNRRNSSLLHTLLQSWDAKHHGDCYIECLRQHQIRLWIGNISINTQGLGNQAKLLPGRPTKRSLADIFNFLKQSAPAATYQTPSLEILRKKCVAFKCTPVHIGFYQFSYKV